MDSTKILFDMLYQRRSIRSYVENKPVEKEKITELLKAAMAAPSACNLQPWEFVVVTDEEAMQNVRECIDAQNGKYYNAPAAFIVCANTSYIPWESKGVMDCAAAIENMMLAATAMGLGTVWIGAMDPGAVRERFDIPEHVAVNSIVLFGYPDEQKVPRTQYTEEAVYWQKYDPKREHPERTTALRFKAD